MNVCASADDLGEAGNIAGWTAVALSPDQAYGFPIEDSDWEYGLDKLFGCLSTPRRERKRRGRGQRALSASINCETTLWTSPTMQRSARAQIGASGSLLMAMIVEAPFMPTACCMAPEMAQAR